MWYIQNTDSKLRRSIAKSYWKAEQRWGAWRVAHPNDNRDGITYSGSPEENRIAKNWKAFDILWQRWKATNPAPTGYCWGIGYPKHEPELFRNCRTVFIEC